MASILDKYGIKEVADVTLYQLDKNGKPQYPVLFLDTLKVSTTEQTAESTDAKGGKGNANLITWDYGKEITLNITDALCSLKSLGVMADGVYFHNDIPGNARKIIQFKGNNIPTSWTGPNNKVVNINPQSDRVHIYDASGNIITGDLDDAELYFLCFDIPYNSYNGYNLYSQSYREAYYLVGDTFIRNANTGLDEGFQFICPKIKINSEFTLELSADGDPAVFNFTARCMRPADGIMMKLVKYQSVETQGVPLYSSDGIPLRTQDDYLLMAAFSPETSTIDHISTDLEDELNDETVNTLSTTSTQEDEDNAIMNMFSTMTSLDDIVNSDYTGSDNL